MFLKLSEYVARHNNGDNLLLVRRASQYPSCSHIFSRERGETLCGLNYLWAVDTCLTLAEAGARKWKRMNPCLRCYAKAPPEWRELFERGLKMRSGAYILSVGAED